MATFTDNHDFGRPIEGGDTDDWGRILNEDLIDLLEQRVVVTDTAANRSTYTPYDDALYLETDTGQWALGDGSNWNDLFPSAFASSTVTATGGSDPAASGTITGVSTDQLDRVDVLHSVNADPAFNADYGVTLSWWPEWDDSDGEVDIGYQLVWQTDPGAGNDVDYDIEVFEQ